MRPFQWAFPAVLMLLAVAPVAQASCHACVEAVAETCTAPDPAGCLEASSHAASHLPGHAVETVMGVASDPEGSACDALGGLACR